MESHKNLIMLNALNGILLLLIAVLYFLFPPVIPITGGILWVVWVAVANYRLLISEKDTVKLLKAYDKKHGRLFRHSIEKLTWNHTAILAKESYFSEQSESIQNAYQLICLKSEKYLNSAIAYMRQYDYVSRPQPFHMQELARNSDILVAKLQELSEDCFKINDAASDIDISIIDDLLSALDGMQDD